MVRILCATDRLPRSEAAIERTGILAEQLGADVTLLHVVMPGEPDGVLEERLQLAQADMEARAQPPLLGTRSQPDIQVSMGNPARMIVDGLKDLNASLLVLGPHRKRPLRDALEGTIAAKALATRRCPVLIVQDEACPAYQRVLLALDPSEASATALRAAEALILAPTASAQIVYAHEPPYQGMLGYGGLGIEARVAYADEWKGNAERVMRAILRDESKNPTRYDLRIEERPPAAGILRAVDLFEPDLLVMGTRGGGRIHRALLGSVANLVLREVACDVLIVPEGSVQKSRDKGVTNHRPHSTKDGGWNQSPQVTAGVRSVTPHGATTTDASIGSYKQRRN